MSDRAPRAVEGGTTIVELLDDMLKKKGVFHIVQFLIYKTKQFKPKEDIFKLDISLIFVIFICCEEKRAPVQLQQQLLLATMLHRERPTVTGRRTFRWYLGRHLRVIALHRNG